MASNQLLQQSLVSPSPAPLDHSVPATFPLTFFDIVWLPAGFVEPLFLYEFPHPTALFMEAYLPVLKSSLSHTLHHFYPLAGRLRFSADGQYYEIRYVDGDSVSFTVVESDLDFLDIVGSHAGARRQSSKLRTLVPLLPPPVEDNTPLLAIQVTVFPNRGICIGYSLHHFACDGSSNLHFLDSWATSCRTMLSNGNNAADLAPRPPPLLNRSVIVDPCNLYSEFLGDVLSFINKNPRPRVPLSAAADDDKVFASFTLGSNQVEWLKSTMTMVRSSSFSKFVVSSAYVWVCLAKTGVWSAERNAHFLFLVDWRKRLGQQLDGYFGNCTGPCFAEAKVSDLLKPAADGMLTACDAVRSAIEELKELGFAKIMAGSTKKVHSVLACQPLTVAGSPRFKVYDIDFGWGRPANFVMASLGAGATSMSESREEQGGVEICIALPKDGMEAFMLHFEEGLKSQ